MLKEFFVRSWLCSNILSADSSISGGVTGHDLVFVCKRRGKKHGQRCSDWKHWIAGFD